MYSRFMGSIVAVTTIVAAMLAPHSARPASKPKVTVVMSRLIPPYKKAIEGFKSVFDCKLNTIQIGQQEGPDAALTLMQAAKPDLVLAMGSSALKLVLENVKTKPVVFTMVLSSPDLPPNAAGVTMILPAEAHLKGLKLVAPTVESVGIVYNPKNTTKRVEEFKSSAKKMNMKIAAFAVSSEKEAFSSIKLLAGRVDAIWMIADRDVVPHFNLMLSLAVKEKIPLATFSYRYVSMGALLALSPRFEELGKQAGEIADRINSGTPPSEIGLVYPHTFYYSFNVETALKIQLGVPPDLLKKDHKIYGK